MGPDKARLLAFAEKLQSATDVRDLLSITADEVTSVIEYGAVWIAVLETETDSVRMLAIEGDNEDDIWAHAPVFPISSDPYMRRILASNEPQLVVDAQVDPNVNREIVEALGNRTIVNIPMWLMDQPFGALGMGTFGEQGVLVPNEDQLAYLLAMTNQLVIASARIMVLRQRAEAAAEHARMQRMLEQQGRLASMGQLAGGVAHDFNNLLTVIMASSEYLVESETDPARRDELNIIREATERAGELTRRLLALGRRQPLQMTNVNAGEMLRSLAELVRRVIPSNIEIRLEINDTDLPVAADRSQLEQVVTNLCLNARDAMPEGGTLTLACEAVELSAEQLEDRPGAEPGPYLEIRVTDSGCGMSPQLLERIFDPFFTTKGPEHGTGLGLVVCKGIVERHDGLIRATSSLSAGTTFLVDIPIRSATRALPEVKKEETATHSGSGRILVADDQSDVLAAMTRALESVGYDVTAVGNGSDAVEQAQREPFDLVILDAVMPALGGRLALEQIRALRPETRFLLVSGYGVEESLANVLAEANAGLLTKPFPPAELLAAVGRTLRGAGDGS